MKFDINRVLSAWSPFSITCPHCYEENDVRRSHRNIVDFWFSWLGIYPFRCGSCAHRFFRLPVSKRARSLTP